MNRIDLQTQRRLCLAESRTRTGAPQVCIRDLDHPGAHTLVERRGLPARIADRLGPASIQNDNEQPRDPATGKFVAKQELAEADTIVLPDPTDPRLEVEALSDLAVATIDDRAFLVDLAVRTFEFEAAACEDAAGRLAAEIEGRDRFLVLAAAAKTAGHHPFTAYCFVADRLDPVGAAS